IWIVMPASREGTLPQNRSEFDRNAEARVAMLIPPSLAVTVRLPGWVVAPLLAPASEPPPPERPPPPEDASARAGRPSAAAQAQSTAAKWAWARRITIDFSGCLCLRGELTGSRESRYGPGWADSPLRLVVAASGSPAGLPRTKGRSAWTAREYREQRTRSAPRAPAATGGAAATRRCEARGRSA